jgi:hypothetical protein
MMIFAVGVELAHDMSGDERGASRASPVFLRSAPGFQNVAGTSVKNAG